MSPIELRELRNAFGAFLTGVTVVTTHDARGNPRGFTANSFTSVSLDPPLVLVCLANTSSNYDAFAKADGFAINILSEAQKEVSNIFARPVEERFASVTWQPGPYGAPVFGNVSAWFDCSMYNTVEAGDHIILIGKVEAFESSAHPGLGYVRGAYVTPAAEAEALQTGKNILVSALVAHHGKILLINDGRGHLTLPEVKVGLEGVTSALKALIADTGTTAKPGFVYSVYEDERRKTQHIAFLCQADDESAVTGVFCELTETTLGDINDPAMYTMLERFAEESRVGNFGIYLGNEIAGDVLPVTKRS